MFPAKIIVNDTRSLTLIPILIFLATPCSAAVYLSIVSVYLFLIPVYGIKIPASPTL